MTSPPLLVPIALACLGLASAPLGAQMTGSYTINPNGTGTRNFTTFGAAVFQTWKVGMGGDVTFVVEPGTYTQTWGIPPIKGMSATRKLTFQSKVKHQAIFKSNQEGVVLDLSTATNPIQGVVFDGFQFTTWRSAIYGVTESVDIEVKNCLFNSTSTGRIDVKYGTRWDIHHCVFQQVPGPIRLEHYADCDIHHNDFRLRQSYYGIWLKNNRASDPGPLRIYNNIMTGLTTGGAGIDVSYGAHNVEITHNTILVNTNRSCIQTFGGFVGRPVRIFSNILVNLNTGFVVHTLSASPFMVQLDGNIYHKGAKGAVFRYNSTNYELGAWQKISGQDKNSYQGDPKLRGGLGAPYDLRPAPTSPAVGKAVNTPTYVVDDFAHAKRFKPSAIGAYEGTGSRFELFGTGCAGSGALVPKLSQGGDLRLGGTIQVILSNALGRAPAFLVVGGARQTIPLGGGCSVLVAPHIVLPMVMGGTTGAGNGVILYPITLPRDTKWRGTTVQFQWAVADPAAAGIGLAMSGGGTLTL